MRGAMDSWISSRKLFDYVIDFIEYPCKSGRSRLGDPIQMRVFMMWKRCDFPVMRGHIITESQVSTAILVMIRIFVYFQASLDIHEFDEIEPRFIREKELAFNNSNVQRTLILSDGTLKNVNGFRDS
jgi:hypothetical protein